MLTEIEGLNCTDGLLISLAESLNRDYALVSAHAWNLRFNDELKEYSNTVGDRLDVDNVVDLDLLKSYCGIGQSALYNTNISLDSFIPIYRQIYDIIYLRNAVSMPLPDCPNTHTFAISTIDKGV